MVSRHSGVGTIACTGAPQLTRYHAWTLTRHPWTLTRHPWTVSPPFRDGSVHRTVGPDAALSISLKIFGAEIQVPLQAVLTH
jgi:hypothetical protein